MKSNMDMAEKPLVCIVVLNYNGREHLDYCLTSVAATAYSNYQIIVVDNASPDGSAELVSALCPSAQLIRSHLNRGWSGGNNVGILTALEMGAQYVVLANNDIRVDPRWVSEAVKLAESDPQVGIIGFQVLEREPRSANRDSGFERAQAIWTEIESSYPKYVGGMAMFVRTELFEQIGLIDEGFFAYCEENDFQIRARKAGYKVVAINVPVWHYGQGAFGKIPARAAIMQTRNNIRLLLKHGSLFDLLNSGLNHFTKRILPSRDAQIQSAVEGRLRFSGSIGNLVILSQAVIWNIWVLPTTIKRRRDDNLKAMVANQKWHPS